MPEPLAQPDIGKVMRVAVIALVAGALLTLFKFAIYLATDSVAVFSDALESIINVVAAGFIVLSLRLCARPADSDHPYGHGRIEILAIAFEGGLILLAGLVILYESMARLLGQESVIDLGRGVPLMAMASVLTLALALYVYGMARRYDNDILRADARHLLIDAGSTLGILVALLAMRWTQWFWLDGAVGLVFGFVALWTSVLLIRQAYHRLMDRIDPEDQKTIVAILDQAVSEGRIRGYHKVRHRHIGPFHWVDMHLQVDGTSSVQQSHDIASRVEGDIEKALGQANASAHVEPYDPASTAEDHGPFPAR